MCQKPCANESSAEQKAYRVPNIILNKYEKFQVHLSNAETEATIWSIAGMDYITGSLEREIDHIMSNAQYQIKQDIIYPYDRVECSEGGSLLLQWCFHLSHCTYIQVLIDSRYTAVVLMVISLRISKQNKLVFNINCTRK